MNLWLLLAALVSILFLQKLIEALWRIYFSPSAAYPGPRLAAVTYLYEIYYDVVQRGLYIWKIRDLHKQYGPIVRINPNEIHVSDPAFYDEIYAGPRRKRNKLPYFTAVAQGTIGGTTQHDHHRQHRALYQSFFQKQHVQSSESLVFEKIQLLCDQMATLADGQSVVNVTHALHAMAIDVLTEFCFADCWNHLQADEFHRAWYDAAEVYTKSYKFFVHFMWMRPIFLALPRFCLGAAAQAVDQMRFYEKRISRQVERVVNGTRLSKSPLSSSNDSQTLFHKVIEDKTSPRQIRENVDMEKEALIIVGAGAAPVAKTTATILYHLCKDSAKLQRLRKEFSTHNIDDSSGRATLEHLPYLNACINEGLRLHHGLSKRSPRVASQETLYFRDWEIPAGTAISTQTPFIHYDEEIFPDAWSFQPDRWLEGNDAEQLALRRRRLVAFGRGSRSCIGRDLALTEICIALSYLLRRFDFDLCGTDDSDVDFQRDLFVPTAKLGSKGIRLRVHRRIEYAA